MYTHSHENVYIVFTSVVRWVELLILIVHDIIGQGYRVSPDVS